MPPPSGTLTRISRERSSRLAGFRKKIAGFRNSGGLPGAHHLDA